MRSAGSTSDSLAKMAIPEGTVAGKLNGLDFAPKQVTYDPSRRELKFAWQGTPDKTKLPDLELRVRVRRDGNIKTPLDQGKVPENVTLRREFRDAPFQGYIVDVIAEDRTENNKSVNGLLTYPDSAYIVEYTGSQGGKLAGKVYICLGDGPKSYLAGHFEAEIIR